MGSKKSERSAMAHLEEQCTNSFIEWDEDPYLVIIKRPRANITNLQNASAKKILFLISNSLLTTKTIMFLEKLWNIAQHFINSIF
jgi:hypothetical protein